MPAQKAIASPVAFAGTALLYVANEKVKRQMTPNFRQNSRRLRAGGEQVMFFSGEGKRVKG
jgi:hypothetical protein